MLSICRIQRKVPKNFFTKQNISYDDIENDKHDISKINCNPPIENISNRAEQ